MNSQPHQGVRSFDVIVVGGGSAGCVLAARLSSDPRRSVALVEAGPDYGRAPRHPDFDADQADRWPGTFLDSNADGRGCHDWGYDGGLSSSRARVIGGCSSHNGCICISGTRADYDEWAAASGDPDWAFDALVPFFAEIRHVLRVRPAPPSRQAPITRAFFAAARELGLSQLEEFDSADSIDGYGSVPLNLRGRLRWNAAFAYLDPVRRRPNLTIIDRTLVDRVEFSGRRAVGVAAIRDGVRIRLNAGMLVLAAGAYATPAILLRSGVGPSRDLRESDVPVVHDLPGVGQHLLDHPYVTLSYTATEALEAANVRHLSRTALFATGQYKGRSSRCDPGGWDFAIPPWSGGIPPVPPAWRGLVGMNPIAMKTISMGTVSLRSRDPEASPAIDHGFLTDPDDHDISVLVDALRMARRLAATRGWRRYAGTESAPGLSVTSDEDVRAWARQTALGTYHPCGTCRMGTQQDPLAVVDNRGAVLGLERLVVADASVFPTIPAVNIHLSVLAVAHRLGAVWDH